MANTTIEYLQDTYNYLKTLLGDTYGYLGKYQFLSNGNPILEDWSISILNIEPDPRLNWQMLTNSGIEAIIEPDKMIYQPQLGNTNIHCEYFKLTLIQHNLTNHNDLYSASRKIYDIPNIKPYESSQFIPSQSVDTGITGTDSSFIPARIIMNLRKNY